MSGMFTVGNIMAGLIIVLLCPILIPLGFIIGMAYGPEDTVPREDDDGKRK